MNFVVDFYKRPDGIKPVAEFIKTLDTKRRRRGHMSDLQDLTNELMKDPDFKREYEALQPEMDITRAILDARIQAGMTQMQLSEKSGISQADISRLEKGTRNPSLSLLKRLAEAMDSTLRIEFVPKKRIGSS